MLFIIIAGIFTAFNYLILAYKFKHKLYKSFIFDLTTFILLNIIFLDTITGMSIAMTASFIISVLTLPKPKITINKPQFKVPKININKDKVYTIVGVVIGFLIVLLFI